MQQLYESKSQGFSWSSLGSGIGWKNGLFYMALIVLLLLYAWLQQPIYLKAGIGIMILYVAVSHVYANFYLLLFLLPSLPLFVTEESNFSLATVLYLAALAKHIVARASKMRLHRIGLVMVLLLIAYEFTHLYGYSSSLLIPTIRWGALLLYAALMIIDLNIKLSFKTAVHAFVAGIVLSSLFGYVMEWGNPAAAIGYTRFEGAGGDPNGFGMLILMAVFFLLHLYKQSSSRYIYIVLAIGLAILGLTTLSRAYFLTAGITLGILLVYMLFTRHHILLKLRKRLLLLIVTVGALFAVPIGSLIQSTLARMSVGETLQDLTGQRSFLLMKYWEGFMSSSLSEMLWGHGVIGYLADSGVAIRGVLTGPHNTYVESLVAWGWLGSFLLAVVVLVLAYCVRLKFKVRAAPGFIAWLPILSTFIFLLSLQSLAKYNTYFFMVMLLMNLYYRGEEQPEDEEYVEKNMTVSRYEHEK
ncbi:hypothetical protein [Paenibacillus sp. 1001270B_150601_E10]|uniref:hypothetical protein n=1 Tax=Paenibacillus sp. 1001270B_150601_E10 TaxID=2787079 RepID=UPI00189EC41C|nr:hypothetical protein [Paenibacillus sp. 1001270B_150601_E10]